MTRSRRLFGTWFTAFCAAAALLTCGAALADPPGRVARLTQMGGAVSFSPAGEQDWVLAQANRPLITGDRVWSDTGSRAELQIGTASARLGSATSVSLLNLDDRIAQIEVAQGTLNLHVRRIYPDQFFEIDTPNLAFSVRRAGDYRVDVDPNGNSTVVRVRSGEGEVSGEGAAYTLAAGQQATFVGEGLRDYSFDALAAPDEFDNWALERDRREQSAVTARYVSPDVVGSSDLDDNGTWRSVEGYGNVWFPTATPTDWAPYHDGHWAWVDPWGWTWIDDAPWGFAPFHYGRWAYVQTRWCWVPGPIAVRPVYAPALVAFIGGGGFSLSIATGPVAGIAWFPLGPGEVYRPGYAASRQYFNNVNVSNTVVNTTVINNVYNNTNVTNIVYRNREAPGAVTAVPTTAFASAEPVARHAIQVPRDAMARQTVSPVAAVTPTHASVLAVGAVAAGAAAAIAVAKRPPPAVLARPVVAKSPPPPPPAPFAAKASLLAAQPGKPIEPEKLKAIQPARPVETAAKVKVVTPTAAPQPLNKAGAGKGLQAGPATPAPTGAAKGPQPPPTAQERVLKDTGKAPPPGAAVPQPPASAQERTLKESSKGPPPGAAVPQPPASAQERMLKESSKGPPPKEASKGPAPAAAVPQPPSAQERMLKEQKSAAPSGPVPQPPKERAVTKGPQPGAATPQSEQERVLRENKSPPPPPPKMAAPPPPPPKVVAPPPPPPKVVAPPPPPPKVAAPPPPPPKVAAPPPPPPKAPPPPPKPEPKQDENKAKEKEKAKEGQ